jgi:hypothetical protein
MGADEIRDLAIRSFNEAIDADGYEDSYGTIEAAIRIALRRNTPEGRINVETLALEVVRAACELDGPADPAGDDAIIITMKDLEAVVHRHLTVALERAALATTEGSDNA